MSHYQAVRFNHASSARRTNGLTLAVLARYAAILRSLDFGSAGPIELWSGCPNQKVTKSRCGYPFSLFTKLSSDFVPIYAYCTLFESIPARWTFRVKF